MCKTWVNCETQALDSPLRNVLYLKEKLGTPFHFWGGNSNDVMAMGRGGKKSGNKTTL
jgi:hypothetical protein